MRKEKTKEEKREIALGLGANLFKAIRILKDQWPGSDGHFCPLWSYEADPDFDIEVRVFLRKKRPQKDLVEEMFS